VATAAVSLAVLAFLWAAKQGQFDDLATPALRVLRDAATGQERTPSGERTGDFRKPGG
jgi:cbb3-type cytochrome oxidase maturation protein